jgi:hypothetical protein
MLLKKSNSYIIEKFELTPAEQPVPINELIKLGIHFR